MVSSFPSRMSCATQVLTWLASRTLEKLFSAALAAAKVHVLRTDATALGWLRGLWPQICARADAARRIVLLDLDGGWDLAVIDEGAPTFLRGIGASPAA